jgi:hypothetical protein
VQRVRFNPLPPTVLVLALGLAACGGGDAVVPVATGGEASSSQADAGYLTAPVVQSVAMTAAGPRLSGKAPPNTKVRLATPEGKALFAEADGKGAWSLALPPSEQARIFGLSATAGARTIQSEGYLLMTPDGEAVLLRAGAGALRVGRGGKNTLDAVDFDREGGAVISGRAPAGALLSIHVDGRKLAEGRADAKGRYAIALTQQPLSGRRQIDVFGDATENPVTLDITPAPPLAAGPFRASAVDAGLRIDWMTPGGGAQSTVLLK